MNYLWAAIAAIVYSVGCVTIGYHFGGQHEVVKEDTHTIQTAQADVKQIQQQQVTDSKAEAIHDQEIDHPPQLAIAEPVRMCPQPTVRIVQVPTQAPIVSAAPGPADAGPGPDLRPALQAFAAKYEAALSDCRRMASEWPQ